MRADRLERLMELARETERLARRVAREISDARKDEIGYTDGRSESVRPEAR